TTNAMPLVRRRRARRGAITAPAARDAAALRALGLRMTRPRRLILDAVRLTSVHPSAAFVYRRVRRRLPRVSLATVYRNLRTLAAEGFIGERADASGLRFGGHPARESRRRTGAISISRGSPTSKAFRTSRGSTRTRPTRRPDTRSGTWTS